MPRSAIFPNGNLALFHRSQPTSIGLQKINDAVVSHPDTKFVKKFWERLGATGPDERLIPSKWSGMGWQHLQIHLQSEIG